MHIELLVEDSSGARLVESLLPRIIGPLNAPHTWRVHAFRGVGRLPPGLTSKADPAKRILLDQLPRLLTGYGKTPGVDAVVVLVDTDDRDCREFLAELNALLARCNPAPRAMFRLAIEEMEAWYFGDQAALLKAYPRAKRQVLQKYRQDTVCGTWERLADAVREGGSKSVLSAGWPLPGQIKHQWAEEIAPHMNVEENQSPSFRKFRDGLRRLIA